MVTFTDHYPSDLETQTKLLLEFEEYLTHLTPEKMLSKRFYFLADYFSKNGPEDLRSICKFMKDQL